MTAARPDPLRPQWLAPLVAQYERPLRAYFAKRAANPAEVDDLVQDVFLRLAASHDHAAIANPSAYIFQAAANLLRDRARRRATWQGAAAQLAHDPAAGIEELSPERVLTGRQEAQRLVAVLETLPERTRAIFLLHRFDGLKYRAIAERLGLSVSAVEKHMAAAIKLVHAGMAEP